MVVAVENGWLERIRSCTLHCYRLPHETFECLDESAGYFVSRIPVVPEHIEALDNVMEELLGRGVQLRFLPDIWSLRDAVVASSLQFSMIRMRNAIARSTQPL